MVLGFRYVPGLSLLQMARNPLWMALVEGAFLGNGEWLSGVGCKEYGWVVWVSAWRGRVIG